VACCGNHISGFSNWCENEDIVYTDERGNEYCIFHAPGGKKGCGAEEFSEKVYKRINDFKEAQTSEKTNAGVPVVAPDEALPVDGHEEKVVILFYDQARVELLDALHYPHSKAVDTVACGERL